MTTTTLGFSDDFEDELTQIINDAVKKIVKEERTKIARNLRSLAGGMAESGAIMMPVENAVMVIKAFADGIER